MVRSRRGENASPGLCPAAEFRGLTFRAELREETTLLQVIDETQVENLFRLGPGGFFFQYRPRPKPRNQSKARDKILTGVIRFGYD